MTDDRLISHYRLIELLGEGGMGAVYRAEDIRLGRHVALKLLPTGEDEKARERFLAEARAVSALEHPYICTLYEFGEYEGQPFIAMQLVEGGTLKQLIRKGPLDERRAREIIVAVASALDAAHARGVVHRDVKSDNILLGKDGTIKLADFGIARLAHTTGMTATHAVVGTPSYMSPEQVRGEYVDGSADQFSLAVVAYECLTGGLPFSADSMTAVMYAVVNLDPTRPSLKRPGLSPAWDDVLARAMAKQPAGRYPSMGEFARAVSACGEGIGVSGTDEITQTTLAPRPRSTSVAVLYFENLSSDRETDYFCAGITEDILTDLSKVPGLLVASRNAVGRYRGRAVDARQVASDLGVGSVVEGSVRLTGQRVRITAQLVNASDGFQIWAERYNRTLEDVFAVQEDIAHAIATALRGALTPAEAAGILSGRPSGFEAYDLYLKGREFYQRYTEEDIRAALECFENAVKIDDRYALAWAGIADCCGQMHDKGWDTDPAWLERGIEAAQRSVALDPSLAEGHKAEALMWRIRRDPQRTMQALRRALNANPRFIPAVINLSQELLCQGDFAGAERALRRAATFDPAYGFSHLLLGLVCFYTRRYREAIEACHRAQNEGGSAFYVTYAYAMRAHAFAEQNNFPAAELELAGGRAAKMSAPILRAAEALIAARSGHADRALRLLGVLERTAPEESYGCELAAAAAGSLGNGPLAVHFLKAAEAIDPRHPAFWRINPDLKPVQESKEFLECIGDRGREIVWPLEAPALSDPERAVFTEYREASGQPEEDLTRTGVHLVSTPAAGPADAGQNVGAPGSGGC